MDYCRIGESRDFSKLPEFELLGFWAPESQGFRAFESGLQISGFSAQSFRSPISVRITVAQCIFP